MGLFKVVGGVVKGTATVVGGVAKGTALVAEGVIKGSMVLAEVLSEDKQKKETNNSSITHNKKNVSQNIDKSEATTTRKGASASPMSETSIEESSALSQSVPVQDIKKSPGNLFSDGLEELINSVAENDELTDKMKEIVLRRAVMEGEDPDEVEMVLEARFYEKHN